MNNVFALVGLASVIALATACTAPTDPSEMESQDETESNILGGSTDTGHASVGMIRVYADPRVDSFSECTGTVVAPRVVVTAGHCAFVGDGTKIGVLADITFEQQPDISHLPGRSSPEAITGQIIHHPDYDILTSKQGEGKDVSVILLDRDAPVPAMKLARAPSVGTNVMAVGFGISKQAVGGTRNAGDGLKRKVIIPITASSQHELTAGSDNLGTCHGDSGGPILRSDGAVVGLVSYGDTADCRGSSHFTRIDDVIDFIAPFLDGDVGNDPAPAPVKKSSTGTSGANGRRGCSVSIQCNNGDCRCGSGTNEGRSCEGRVGSADSCSAVCADCR